MSGNIPGSVPLGGLFGGRGPGAPAPAPNAASDGNGGQMSEQKIVQYMQAAMESCPAKTVLAGTMGFGLGAMFGIFMSSMRYDTPLSSPSAAAVASLPIKQQLSTGFRDMGRASLSSAKNFGKVGALFSGTECCIEGLRAKNELSNGVAAGCVTGGILAKGGGPQAMVVGCAGFAVFSAAIDTYMRRPSEETLGKID